MQQLVVAGIELILFFSCTLFLVKLIGSRKNYFSDFIISVITVICMMQSIVAVLNIFGVPIRNITIVIIYLLLTITLGIVGRKKSVTVLRISRYEIAVIVGISITFLIITLAIFTKEIKWTYLNSDPSVHFKNAMVIYRNGSVSGMYYASLINSSIIEAFSGILSPVKLYKAYIVADILMNYLQVIFFFALMSSRLENIKSKIVFPFLMLLFWCGFPMDSYVVRGYNYWGIGAMLVLFVMYWLERYLDEKENRKWIFWIISIGCFCVSICYMLFAPFTFIAVFIVLLWIHVKEGGKIVSFSFVKYNLRMFLLPTIFTICYCLFQYFGGTLNRLKDLFVKNTIDMTTTGPIGQNVENAVSGVAESLNIQCGSWDIGDPIIFLLPILIWYVITHIKNKKIEIIDFFFILYTLMMVVFFVFNIAGVISGYYFYKLYMPYWIIIWIIIIDFVKDADMNQLVYYGCIFLVTICSMLQLEDRMPKFAQDIYIGDELELYSHNMWSLELIRRYASNDIMTTERRELYTYIMEEIEGTTVIIENGDRNAKLIFLYEALTGNPYASECYSEYPELKSVFISLAERGNECALLFKDSPFYEDNLEFLCDYEVVKESDEEIVYRIQR